MRKFALYANEKARNILLAIKRQKLNKMKWLLFPNPSDILPAEKSCYSLKRSPNSGFFFEKYKNKKFSIDIKFQICTNAN